MKLAKEQIQELFAFTEKKYVRYYDLQMELVDHLAERIEEEMEANKNVSFQMALDKVYAGFGLFGFAKIVQQKEAEVLKNNDRIWWQELKSYFTIPRIFFSLLLFTLAYLLSGIIEAVYLGVALMFFWIIYSIAEVYFFHKHKKRKIKKILLLQYTPYTSSTWIFVYQYIFIVKFDNINRLWFTIAIVSGVIIQLCYLELYKKIKSRAESLYPEAFA